jgi:hypothetical protein
LDDARLPFAPTGVCVAAILALLGAGISLPAAGAAPVQFTEFLISGDYTYPFGIAAADIDRDGDLDLTSSDALPHNNLYWFENDGQCNFTRHFIQRDDPQPRLERHAVADINADGHLDVVIVENLEGDLKWFENDGTPRDDDLWKLRRITVGTIPGAYDVAVADYDGDGDLDVAASSWRLSNKFTWYENDGTPEDEDPWTERVIEENVAETRTICAADFDADGDPDLLGGARVAGLVVWYENPGDPKAEPFVRHVIDDTAAWASHGHPVDMDGDGDLDVVMASGIARGGDPPGKVVWYENDGTPADGPWEMHVVCDPFDQGFEAIAGDLDADGDMDVVATEWNAPGRVVWFENLGDPKGPWTMRPIKENWVNANQVIAADLDADGDLDLAAVAERDILEFRWWRNGGPVQP